MQLVLQTQKFDDVAVIRCRGRTVTGNEVRALEHEFEKTMLTKNKIVLQLAEVNFIDSVGLGALVRFFGVLRNARGGQPVGKGLGYPDPVAAQRWRDLIFHDTKLPVPASKVIWK